MMSISATPEELDRGLDVLEEFGASIFSGSCSRSHPKFEINPKP